jgi:3-hydroxybutyryl-CoA dehydrogenase
MIEKVAVVGAGTMGLGIAQVCAMAGYKVQLYDTRKAAVEAALSQIANNLDKGVERGKLTPEIKASTLSNVSSIDTFKDFDADIVIEAILEDLSIKIDLFSSLEKILPDTTLLCSNTSSIPVTKIAAGISKPNRMIGMHFFNPAHIMKLVEVISTKHTSQDNLNKAISFVESLGKNPVVAKDSPGFIVNRVARHFYVESLKVVEDGVADFNQIDLLIEATGFKMGPFRLMDLIGVDTNFAVTQTMFNGFHQDPKFRPSRIQEEMVNAGLHGRKTGKGFYQYE